MFNFPLAPPQASNFAGECDTILFFLTLLTLAFTAIVGFGVVYLAVRYRRGSKVDRSRPVHESRVLELTWSVIPLLLGLVMFAAGAHLFIRTRSVPDDATEIFVVGKQWMWHLEHENGVRENNTLHVPIGKPIKLTMISQDVVHAFYIPEFRIQYHVVPGRYTTQWFIATKPGTYHLFCAMYCGTQHSEMGGYVYAMDPKDYAKWLNNGGNNVPDLTMAQRGEKLYHVLACDNCHKDQDTKEGPALAGIYNKPRQLATGESVLADDAYLRESILRPYQKITAGYINTMPQYEGQVSEEDVLNLTAYMKSLAVGQGNSAGVPPEPPQKGGVNTKKLPDGPLSVNSTKARVDEERGRVKLGETGLAVNAVAEKNRTKQ